MSTHKPLPKVMAPDSWCLFSFDCLTGRKNFLFRLTGEVGFVGDEKLERWGPQSPAQLHYNLGEEKGTASINAAFMGRLLRLLLPSMLGKHLYSDCLQTRGLEFLKTKQKAHVYNPRTREAETWVPGAHWPVGPPTCWVPKHEEPQDCCVHTCHTWVRTPSHTKNWCLP